MGEEEEDKDIKEEMEQETKEEAESKENIAEKNDTLLATVPGEEDKEDMAAKDEMAAEDLLRDKAETMQEEEEEVREKIVEEEVVMAKEEQGGRVEITTFKEVMDLSDPLNVNPSESLKIW